MLFYASGKLLLGMSLLLKGIILDRGVLAISLALSRSYCDCMFMKKFSETLKNLDNFNALTGDDIWSDPGYVVVILSTLPVCRSKAVAGGQVLHFHIYKAKYDNSRPDPLGTLDSLGR